MTPFIKSLIFMAACLIGVSTVQAQDDLDRIRDTGKIRIGTEERMHLSVFTMIRA